MAHAGRTFQNQSNVVHTHDKSRALSKTNSILSFKKYFLFKQILLNFSILQKYLKKVINKKVLRKSEKIIKKF